MQTFKAFSLTFVVDDGVTVVYLPVEKVEDIAGEYRRQCHCSPIC